MNSRKQFEAWLNPLWHLETFKGSDDSLQYRDEVIQGKWEAWQAASTALEQQLAALAANNALLKDALLEEGYRYFDADTEVTDAYLAEVRAQARNEGINYAASRLAAAFNHGFVDKPLAEVYDVVRMILTTKEDLANDPAADGLSGEYAEKSLAEFAAQLRQGAEHE